MKKQTLGDWRLDMNILDLQHEVLYECIHVVISVCQIGYVMCVAKLLMTITPIVALSSILQTFDLIRGRDSIV